MLLRPMFRLLALGDDGDGRMDVLPLVVNGDRRRWLEGGVASGICCEDCMKGKKQNLKEEIEKKGENNI